MQVDFAAKELTLKLVYYGPALSGKTTNLRAIHWMGTPNVCGQLMTFDTRNDRTLFFDMLPISVCSESGLRVRLKLFAVPGQVMHDATRRLVLQSVDGVAFIADSRRSETAANRESFLNLKKNLEDNHVDPAKVPIIVQFNKRDLDDVRSDEEIAEVARRSREPVYQAVATRGLGVMQTLIGLIRETWNALDAEHSIERKLGVDPLRIMREIESRLGYDGSRAAR